MAQTQCCSQASSNLELELIQKNQKQGKHKQEGDAAPDFELKANDGSLIHLETFKNKKNVVLCFYPKNHLFACPSKKVFKMAQSVVSSYSDIVSCGAVLFAISIDTVEEQKKFVDAYNIP